MSIIPETVISKLPSEYGARAKDLFNKYGEGLEGQVGTALLYARDEEKLEETLEKLTSHHRECVHYQHPEIRGTHSLNIDFFNELNESLGAKNPK
jgi:hypothetical protein